MSKSIWLEDIAAITDLGGDVPMSKVEQLVRKIEKAYGDCQKCFGKGYSTNRYGTTASPDFEGDKGSSSPLKTHMTFCDCDRGKQLSELTLTLY